MATERNEVDPRWRLIDDDGNLRPHVYVPDSYMHAMGDCICGNVENAEIHILEPKKMPRGVNKNPLNDLTSHVLGKFECPRCGGNHFNYRFDPIAQPADAMFRHWAMCVSTRSPILLFWDGETARVK